MDFPLLSYAIRFYNYPNPMVRAAVQNITLNILKRKCFSSLVFLFEIVSNNKLDIYLTNFPFISYFVNLACYLKDLWVQIDEVLPESQYKSSPNILLTLPSAKNNAKLCELLDSQYDLLIYIDDIFRLGREKISQVLPQYLLYNPHIDPG